MSKRKNKYVYCGKGILKQIENPYYYTNSDLAMVKRLIGLFGIALALVNISRFIRSVLYSLEEEYVNDIIERDNDY